MPHAIIYGIRDVKSPLVIEQDVLGPTKFRLSGRPAVSGEVPRLLADASNGLNESRFPINSADTVVPRVCNEKIAVWIDIDASGVPKTRSCRDHSVA